LLKAADRTSIMTTAIGGIVGGLGSFAEGGGFAGPAKSGPGAAQKFFGGFTSNI